MKSSSPLEQQIGGLAGESRVPDGPGHQPRPLHKRTDPLRLHEAAPEIGPDIPVDPDIPGALRVHAEVGPLRTGTDIHRSPAVERKEPAQAVAVVIVSVGQHRRLHRRQVHPQLPGVVGKSSGGAGIQQKPVPPVLDVQGQPVLRRQAAALRSGIFHQYGNLHTETSYALVRSLIQLSERMRRRPRTNFTIFSKVMDR